MCVARFIGEIHHSPGRKGQATAEYRTKEKKPNMRLKRKLDSDSYVFMCNDYACEFFLPVGPRGGRKRSNTLWFRHILFLMLFVVPAFIHSRHMRSKWSVHTNTHSRIFVNMKSDFERHSLAEGQDKDEKKMELHVFDPLANMYSYVRLPHPLSFCSAPGLS